MNPLRELKALVGSVSRIESGTVVTIGITTINVRSRGGLKSFSTPNPKAFKTGDTVRFQGNVLLGKAVSAESLPVFKV